MNQEQYKEIKEKLCQLVEAAYEIPMAGDNSTEPYGDRYDKWEAKFGTIVLLMDKLLKKTII